MQVSASQGDKVSTVEVKIARWSSKSIAIYFGVLVFFILQILMIRDATICKVKLKHIFSISWWGSNVKVESHALNITCDRTHEHYDLCSINGPTLLDQTPFTLFALGPHTTAQPNTSMKIQPYPLKNDKRAMSNVRELTLTSSPPKSSHCDVTHHTPALVFSAGGYNGNFYHEMNENIIPLFLTITSLFPNKNVILVITDSMHWWLEKYAELLSAFSPYHTIINTKNLTTTHCFPSATIGLIKHGDMIIDPKLLPYPKTLFDFHSFLISAYIKNDTKLMYPNNMGRPQLTLVNRKGNSSRRILNQDEVIKVAEEVGFNVHVLEPSKKIQMLNACKLIHESHVMLGVHGAGLTNLLFLKPNSVLVQVIPIGLDWAATTYYENPTKVLGLEYIDYKIEANESSLTWSYGADSLVIKDPKAFCEGKWAKRRIYLNNQNVKIDVVRFRKCLTKAYEKAKISMNSST